MLEGFPQEELTKLSKTIHDLINLGDQKFGFALVVFPIANEPGDICMIGYTSDLDRETSRKLLQAVVSGMETFNDNPNPDLGCS